MPFDISIPSKTHSGRYWYNLHLVIVNDDRESGMTKKETFQKISDYIPKIALKKSCNIAKFAIMPDHIHIDLRGNVEISPFDIGLSFMNNLAYGLNSGRCWSDRFYVGTFGSYDLSKIGCEF